MHIYIYINHDSTGTLYSCQAAQKLMDGLNTEQLDGFLKLRTYQKESQPAANVGDNKKKGETRKGKGKAPILDNTGILLEACTSYFANIVFDRTLQL